MKVVKDMVFRKYNDFFISLKNNLFDPNLFYDALSLSNAYLSNYLDFDLGENEKKIREMLLAGYMWNALTDSVIFDDKIENKTEFNIFVKSNYSSNSMEYVNLIKEYISKDESIINRIFKEFKVIKQVKKIQSSYPDIKSKWSVGIVKDAGEYG